MSKVISPITFYKEELPDFAIEELHNLIADRFNTKKPFEGFTIKDSHIRKALQRAAKAHKTEFNKNWVPLSLIHIAAAGWHIQMTPYHYLVRPANFSFDEEACKAYRYDNNDGDI